MRMPAVLLGHASSARPGAAALRGLRAASCRMALGAPRLPRARRPLPAAMAHGSRRDFKQAEAARPAWDDAARFRVTRTVDPGWAFGAGPNRLHAAAAAAHVAVDPHEPGRPALANYKLLISAVVPRPIALLSTRSPDGAAENLAPFSYFNVVGHDPPLFVVGFASGPAGPKDSLRNVAASREAVVNLVAEPYLEAANAASIDAPYGASEWPVTGLTPVRDCLTVRCPRVGEAVVSIEVKLESLNEYRSKTSGKLTTTLAVFEGTRFWVRQDALNEQRDLIDPAVLRPISRMGGIAYARTTDAVELARPTFQDDLGGHDAYDKLNESSKQ